MASACPRWALAAALGLSLPVLAASEGASSPAATASALPSPTCRPDPLAGRPLYLRGSFNGWTTDDRHRFTWACDRWELVTQISGEHRFKLGDEAWSADADFGAPAAGAAADAPLTPRGPELLRRFAGAHRIVATPPATGNGPPRLRIDDCLAPPPLGETVLHLRGTMNNWAALDDQALRYHCDAYYLNLRLAGRHEFRISDAADHPDRSFGAGPGAAPWVHVFDGEHTLRLSFTQGRPQLQIGPKTFADPRPPRLTDPVALSLRFDSQAATHKQPFGAVPAGQRVRFAVTAAPGVDALTLVIETRSLEGNQERLHYSEHTRTPMRRSRQANGRERFEAQHRFDPVAVYGYWFEARINGRRFVLQNNAEPVAWTREKGAGGAGAVTEHPATTAQIRRFRQSVYRPDFSVPAWAGDAVYYQVFPERFRNGDPGNDPRPGSRRYQAHDIERHPRWLGKPWRPGSGDGSDAAHNNDFFGGDLVGLIHKLDHLKALGITALYTTPVFHAPSNHKYDHADYQRIDPGFGTEADFRRLTREAARRGMRVVIDASLNHTGSDSKYFDRYGNFRAADGRSDGAFAFGKPNPASPYAPWYGLEAQPADPDRPYKAWVGIADLPELDKSSAAWRDFAYRAPDSITRRWLQAGAGGWRMDVAPWVPDDFWREWRQVVKATRPDAVTIAETWFDPAKHLLGDMFDGSMNYVFRNAVLDFAAGGSALALARQLEHLREQLPPPALHTMMNLLSSHDVPRALHVLGDQGPDTPAERRAEARQRLLLATALQMAYPGAPSVYYGDEVGMTGGEDPYNRAPYPWEDEGGQPDRALEAQVRQLIMLRHAVLVLRHGAMLAPLLADESVLVLARELPASRAARAGTARWAITAFNSSPSVRTVTIRLPNGVTVMSWRDLLAAGPTSAGRTAQRLRSNRSDRLGLTLSLHLPPMSAQWWVPASAVVPARR